MAYSDMPAAFPASNRETTPAGSRRFWRGSLVETVAALRYRDEKTYEDWLDIRDTTAIAAALSRLSERQLNRIGLSNDTLVLDIEDLKEIARRNREISDEALSLVGGTDHREEEAPRAHQMAAE